MRTNQIIDPQITGEAFDMAVLTSFEEVQVEGEPDLIVELIDLYLEETPPRIVALEAALALRGELALQRAAHSLKGSSASLGAGNMALICDELERIAQDGFFPEGTALLKRLKLEFNRVQRAFMAERERRCT